MWSRLRLSWATRPGVRRRVAPILLGAACVTAGSNSGGTYQEKQELLRRASALPTPREAIRHTEEHQAYLRELERSATLRAFHECLVQIAEAANKNYHIGHTELFACTKMTKPAADTVIEILRRDGYSDAIIHRVAENSTYFILLTWPDPSAKTPA
jgi:hypothetical protein